MQRSATADVIVTHHALDRYRQRFDPSATADKVAALVREAHPAPAWVRKALHNPRSGSDEYHWRVNGETVFAIALDRRRRMRVVTCWPLSWARSDRRAYGKKKAKQFKHRR